jgi:hypothetical protein
VRPDRRGHDEPPDHAARVNRRGQAGQTAAEYVGGLLLVALIVGALATGGLATAIAHGVEQAICAITGGTCETSEPARAQRAVGGPDQGPALTGGAIAVLPFPGSISVTCGFGDGSEKTCDAPKGPGVRIQGSATIAVERSPTKLDGKGCPQQTVSVATTLKLERVGSAKGEKASGKLSAFLGHQTKYAITVPPDQVENIEHGCREAPNPLDPRTMAPGESVQMSEEFYRGLGLSGDYAKLQASLGYWEGRRVSSGAKRIDPTTVRVYVGDEDFVRNALAVGVGSSAAKVEVGFSREMSDGKLKSVDIDVSSPEGWRAYQQFVTTGHLPDGAAPGTIDASSATTRKVSQSAKLEATFGTLKVGGLLKDAEGNYVATTHADGGVEHNLAVRYQDVGLEVGVREDARGNPMGDRTYALNLEGVRPDVFTNFQALNFGDARPPADGNVRWDFTPRDLMAMRSQALEQIAFEMEQRGADPRPSADEVAENLERNHGVIKYGPHGVEYSPEGAASVLANARNPEEVLEGLYRLANGDPNVLLSGPLTDFVLRTNAANGDAQPSERGRLPGAVHAPDCAR